MRAENRQEAIKLRIVYAIVFVALSWPLIQKYSLPPARMNQAEKVHSIVESLEVNDGDIVFVALDFGPSTIAENEPQSKLFMEHLMRRRIPFSVFSLYALSSSFLKTYPEDIAEQLEREMPGETWEYGKDWVNLGYQPGGGLFLQSLAKAKDLPEFLKKDANGTPLSEVEAFKNVKDLKSVKLLGEFTGLTGIFNAYVQFFRTDEYTPEFVHGCTSITIPDAYIYIDSGQLNGLFEGIAGAAWYSTMLSDGNQNREGDQAQLVNTALGVAHLVLIALIIVGNVSYFWNRRKEARA